MIISHKYKFIFIKTRKTAGTSIELFLFRFCESTDSFTSITPPLPGHKPQNDTGFWNPFGEITPFNRLTFRNILGQFIKGRKYYNHISSFHARNRIGLDIWNNYFKFCIERNPWDKVLSHYHMQKSAKSNEQVFADFFSEAHLENLSDFEMYTDPKETLLVNQVVPYENLNTELGEIFARLGIPFNGTLTEKAKSNYRTDHTPYQQIYTPAQREIVAKAFAREIAMFGYTFD